MAKGGKDPAEKARRRMARVSRKLRAAHDEHEREQARGQQDVERARLQAGKRLAKITQRVERLTESLARAEADLGLAVRNGKPRKSRGIDDGSEDASRPDQEGSSKTVQADVLPPAEDGKTASEAGAHLGAAAVQEPAAN
jgi:hypothetical protein